MAVIVERLREQGLHPSPLPLGLLRIGEDDGCILCNTCNSFVCKRAREKRSGRVLRSAGTCAPQCDALDECNRRAAFTRTRSGCRIESVDVRRNGEVVRVHAPLVIVSCGAVNSAALLLRSATNKHPAGLANSSGLVGTRYMAHLATMMQGFHPLKKNSTVFQKTVAINDFYLRGPDADYPLGQIQSQGRTHGVMAQTVVAVDSAVGV